MYSQSRVMGSCKTTTGGCLASHLSTAADVGARAGAGAEAYSTTKAATSANATVTRDAWLRNLGISHATPNALSTAIDRFTRMPIRAAERSAQKGGKYVKKRG